MKTSLEGLFTGEAATAPLASAIKTGVHQQASYTHFSKLVSLSAGVIELANTRPVAGVLVDVSPKGDSGSFETSGYEWVVVKTPSSVAIDNLVTAVAGDGGTLTVLAAATDLPTTLAREAQRLLGIWKVEAVKTENAVDYALIRIDARL